MQILRLPLILVAEIRWRLRRAIASFQVAKAKDSLPPLESPNGEAIARFSDSIIEEDRRWLAKMLVNYPYWLGGHSAFAQLSLQTNDIAPAYASAQAMQKLSKSKQINDDSKLILAKCYLRRGVAAEALPLLEELHLSNLARIDIAEEFAAALIACDQYHKAAEIFSKIPPEKTSAQGQAAKLFVGQRISQHSK